MSNVNIPSEIVRRIAYFRSKFAQATGQPEVQPVTTTAVPTPEQEAPQPVVEEPVAPKEGVESTVISEPTAESKPRRKRRKSDVVDADGDGIPDSEEEHKAE